MPQTVIPQLRTTDTWRGLPFAGDGLGYTVDRAHRFEPHLPLFAQLTRARQTVFLTKYAGDCRPGGGVLFWVDDAAACHAAFVARGVTTLAAPERTPDGTLEVVVTDPDGSRLRWSRDLEPD